MKNRTISGLCVDVVLSVESREGIELACIGCTATAPFTFQNRQQVDEFASELSHAIFYMVQYPDIFSGVIKLINEKFQHNQETSKTEAE